MKTNDIKLYIAFYLSDRYKILNWIDSFRNLQPKLKNELNISPLIRIKINMRRTIEKDI